MIDDIAIYFGEKNTYTLTIRYEPLNEKDNENEKTNPKSRYTRYNLNIKFLVHSRFTSHKPRRRQRRNKVSAERPSQQSRRRTPMPSKQGQRCH